MFKNKKEPLMTFMTAVPGLAEDPLCQPQPAMKFIPEEWKKVPRYSSKNETPLKSQKRRTVKACPSFADWFTKGVILPAWCDMSFKYDKSNNEWHAVAGLGNGLFKIKAHPNAQMLDHMEYKARGDRAQLIFKIICPWVIKTKKGYSTLQLPLFYHSTRSWQIMPGIWESDISVALDQQLAYFGDSEEVFIKKGDPLVHYIPIKRQRTKFKIRKMNNKDIYELQSSQFAVESKSGGGWLAMPRKSQEDE